MTDPFFVKKHFGYDTLTLHEITYKDKTKYL